MKAMSQHEQPTTLKAAVEAFTREFCRVAVAEQNENISAAARALGVHRNTLAKILKQPRRARQEA